MTDRRDDIDSLARRAEAATKRVTGEARDAAEFAVDRSREVARRAFEKIKAARAKATKINTLADEARSAAERIAGEAHDESKAAVVELHRVARKAGRKLEEAEETTKRILKLVD